MFAHVKCFVLAVLVAESLCAPAPGVYRVGVSHGLSGRTALTGGAKGKVDMKDGVADGTGSAKIGGSGSGSIDGGVFVQANDKIVEAAGDYHGSAGGWASATGKGQIGRNSHGTSVLGGTGKTKSNSEHSGAGSAGIYTNEDALSKFNEHHSRSADDILAEIDEDF